MSVFRKIIFALAGILFIANTNAQGLHAHWDIKQVKVNDSEFDILFSVKIDPTWHMYSSVPSVPKTADETVPNPTVIKFKKSDDYELVGKLKESKPIEEFDKVFEVQVKYFCK